MTTPVPIPPFDCPAICPEHGNTCLRRIGPGHGKYPDDWRHHQCQVGPDAWQVHYFTQDLGEPPWKEPQ